ncbi:16S rRNA (cytosine(1402)-N(4))-methyltransferase RsmH [Armatimonas rosea]|uniref:Ribosomal RNA small subunit methyltransferase H n=1 Tax=Armatimonas rosea TaxID=685828 RepID=A0A7W9SPE6_ARMRO|nr:16S rRNA (cytosine(1402)-N(4))-methyltransferase RsmH [Armatimonas rosea]MBB6049733.1 16S rRNA (cytosine1402-N4)-methyltransferase [Armatimonas rosea]
MSTYHTPVLLKEILEWLDPQPGKTFLDGTAGGGGHTRAFAERGAHVIAVDQDPEALAECERSCVGLPVTLWRGNFADLKLATTVPLDGILLDLGVSSHQLDTPERGFAIRFHGPLDMRMGNDDSDRETAAELLNRLPESEIARILFEYGEESRSRRIAAEIVKARPLKTTEDLVDCVRRAMPFRTRPGEIHPATKTFQGIRIAVNEELGVLEQALPDAVACLKPGGRLAVISYHSLEDRLVKTTFNELAGKRENSDLPHPGPEPPVVLEILTKKPITPGDDELRQNPRSRSAKLRVGQKR